MPEIGHRFGGRDETTVLHAVRKIEQLVTNDAAFANEIQFLIEGLMGPNDLFVSKVTTEQQTRLEDDDGSEWVGFPKIVRDTLGVKLN